MRSTILRGPAGIGGKGRIEELFLRFTADPVHGAGSDVGAACQRLGDMLKEGVAQVWLERPRRGHHGG